MAESKIPSLKNKIRSQIRMLRAELQKPEAIGRKETMDAQIREQVLALLSRLRAEKKIAWLPCRADQPVPLRSHI